MRIKVTLTMPPSMYEILVKMAHERDMKFDALCSELVMVGAVDMRRDPARIEDHIDRGASSLVTDHNIVMPSRRSGL